MKETGDRRQEAGGRSAENRKEEFVWDFEFGI